MRTVQEPEDHASTQNQAQEQGQEQGQDQATPESVYDYEQEHEQDQAQKRDRNQATDLDPESVRIKIQKPGDSRPQRRQLT